MEWAQRMGERVTKTKKEVREFAKTQGEQGKPTALVVGTEVHDFVTGWGRAVRRRGRETDWEGLEAAATQPDFRLRDWIEERPSTSFKKRPAEPGEIELLLGEETGHGGQGQDDAGGDAGGAADDPGGSAAGDAAAADDDDPERGAGSRDAEAEAADR
jgi:hypothetical protein